MWGGLLMLTLDNMEKPINDITVLGTVDMDRQSLIKLLIEKGPNARIPVCLTEKEVKHVHQQRIKR